MNSGHTPRLLAGLLIASPVLGGAFVGGPRSPQDGGSLLTWSPTPPPDITAIHEEARTHHRQGRYAEALQRYVWLFRHGVQHVPSYVGVRSSFLLGAWADLNAEYPQAREAMFQERHRLEQSLLGGHGGRDDFSDVRLLDSRLGESERTYDLFLEIRRVHPNLARELLPEMIGLFARHEAWGEVWSAIPDPEGRLDRMYEVLTSTLERGSRSMRNVWARRDRPPGIPEDEIDRALEALEEGCLKDYAREASIVIEAAWRTIGASEGRRLRVFALDLVRNPGHRARIAQLTVSPTEED